MSKLWRRRPVEAGLGLRLALALLVVAGLLSPAALSVSGMDTITTVAGTGPEGFSGDGGPATQAQLNYPVGLALDGTGNLYIADRLNHRVRRVNPEGIITTVAGTGTQGFSGDGGPATQAQLAGPMGVALDGAGNLYIADSGNQRVRRVRADGVITTVAGNGTAGFSGDGGPAASARLSFPNGVALDGAGNLYIGDWGNNRVRVVTPRLEVQPSRGLAVSGADRITTVAGTASKGYSGDGGAASQAQLNGPRGVAIDKAGNLYIADTGNHIVRRVSARLRPTQPRIITTVAGTGTQGLSGDDLQARSLDLNTPSDVALDGAGNLYIADAGSHRVRRVRPNGIMTTVAGGGFGRDGGPASKASLYVPRNLALDGSGNLYIAEGVNRVRKVANILPSASFAATPAGQPLAVSFDASASSDPNGQIISYAWQFGDGKAGSGKTTSHRYEKAGSFKVKLTVTDDSGAKASIERTIAAVATPPGQRQPPSGRPAASDTKAPSAPRSFRGRFRRGTLLLSWRAASDDVGVDHYRLSRDGKRPRRIAGAATRTSIGRFRTRKRTLLTLQALDAAGNRSVTAKLSLTPRRRPAGIPRAIPTWAQKLYVWQTRGRKGARPATPKPLPGWYARWKGWRLAPYTIRS